MFMMAWAGLDFSMVVLGKIAVEISYDCFSKDDMWPLFYYVVFHLYSFPKYIYCENNRFENIRLL